MLKAQNTLKNSDSKVQKHFIIANSVSVSLGDAVQLTSGFVTRAGTTGGILGVVTAIVDERGLPVTLTNGTIATGATNTTVAKLKAVVNVSNEDVYSAPLDAAPGTTTGSNLVGAKFNLVSAGELDESTAATGVQFISLGLDPKDATKVLVKILTSALIA